MRAIDSEGRLRVRLARCANDLATLSVADGVAAMLDFYRQELASDCAAENGDMILYQWGVHDWGHGPSFELDLTRQFIIQPGNAGDDDMRQLHLTFYFSPDRFTGVSEGNKWCQSTEELTSFERFLFGSEAYRLAASLHPTRVSVAYEAV
jgi:hypothetical protein